VWRALSLSVLRPANREGAQSPLEKFSPPLEKYVGHYLKVLDIVKTILATLRKAFAPLVSQAGYGPECTAYAQNFCVSPKSRFSSQLSNLKL